MQSVQDYKVYNCVGKGGFGNVFRAERLSTGEECAIKFIDKKRMLQNAGMVKRVKQEVAIHSRLKHPSILEVFNFFEDENFIYLVLEFCSHGNLNSLLNSNKRGFSENKVKGWMREVVEGLKYLHSHQIIHRDLTLSNLLLNRDMRLKISDFGLATLLQEDPHKHLTLCGTPNYISPEVLMRKPQGKECDVWAVGCILFALITGAPPFDAPHVKETLQKITTLSFQVPSHVSKHASSLIRALLQKQPQHRIKLEEILHHPFFSESYPQSDSSQSLLSSGVDSGRGTLASDHPRKSSPQAFKLLSTPSSSSSSFPFHNYSFVSSSNCQKKINFDLKSKSHFNKKKENNTSQAFKSPPSSPSFSFPHPVERRETSFHWSIPLDKQANSFNNDENLLNEYSALPTFNQSSPDLKFTQLFHKSSNLQEFFKKTQNSLVVKETTSAYSAHSFRSKSCESVLKGTLPTVLSSSTSTFFSHPVSFSTLRLRSMTHRAKNAFLSITEEGLACGEFFRGGEGEEKVHKVMVVTSEGKEVFIKENHPPLPSSDPPSFETLIKSGFKKHFHSRLPQGWRTKYDYISRFVSLVRCKTPKVTLYTGRAKCMLMENFPFPDFQVDFYSGYRFLVTSLYTKITDKESNLISLPSSSFHCLAPKFVKMWNHVTEAREMCRTFESLGPYNNLSISCFPLVIGRFDLFLFLI